MVKHGLLIAKELKVGGRQYCFKTNIHRNNGHEFDLPLLDTEEAVVTFDLITRDTYTPWGKPDEITFDACVVCKCCGQRARFKHGRTGAQKGTESETFTCLCGRCAVRLDFIFQVSSPLDVLDWVPGLGAALRVGVAVVLHAVKEDEAAEEQWSSAANHIVPNAIRKRRLLAKDGAITKIAELLPGSNLVAALLHASQGNLDEATRALDLLQSWQDIGSPDGALAKLAEAFPGTDLAAFALHLRAGSFARALRAVTVEDSVTVRIASAGVLLDFSKAALAPRCLDITLSGLQIGPTRRSVAGALVDLLEDYLGTGQSSSGSPAASPLSARAESPSCGSRDSADDWPPLDESVGSTVGFLGLDRTKQLKGSALKRVEGLFPMIVEATVAQLPSILRTVLVVLGNLVATLRTGSRLARWLLPETAPYPDDALTEQLLWTLAEAIRTATIVHHEALPQVDPVDLPDSCGMRCGARCSVLAVVALLLLLLQAEMNRCVCLVGLAVALREARDMWPLRGVAKRLASTLTVHNFRMWSTAIGFAACADRDRLSVRKGLLFGLGRGLPSPTWLDAPPGVVVEVPPHLVARLAYLARSYVLWDLLRAGPLLHLFEAVLRLLGRALLPGVAAVPLAIPVGIPELRVGQPTTASWPFKGKILTLPETQLVLVLDINPGLTGPYLLRARVVAPSASLSRLTKALAAQVSEWDLRCCSKRLSDFPHEVRVHFGLALRWSCAKRLLVELTGISSTVRLPP